MPTVLIALGSNLGNRQENLAAARRFMQPEVRLLAESSVHETAPWGHIAQPDFLNQALLCETELDPHGLLVHLKAIEQTLGRVPGIRYGPRPIDLDILAYDELVHESPGLTIPHPHLHERRFVLAPLVEIAPDWLHPVLGKTALELLAALGPENISVES